jgi:hypothetical protein
MQLSKFVKSPVTGAVKKPVKEARRIKAANPPNWTGAGRASKPG